ncbi:predicted protein [Streptomyces albidoflavus]|nr:predicted protein [Streptomyces albidoflavus]
MRRAAAGEAAAGVEAVAAADSVSVSMEVPFGQGWFDGEGERSFSLRSQEGAAATVKTERSPPWVG